MRDEPVAAARVKPAHAAAALGEGQRGLVADHAVRAQHGRDFHMQPADAPERVRNAGALDAQLLRIAHMLKPAAAAVAVHGQAGRCGGRGREQFSDAGDCIAPAFLHKLGPHPLALQRIRHENGKAVQPGHTPCRRAPCLRFPIPQNLLRHAFIPLVYCAQARHARDPEN